MSTKKTLGIEPMQGMTRWTVVVYGEEGERKNVPIDVEDREARYEQPDLRFAAYRRPGPFFFITGSTALAALVSLHNFYDWSVCAIVTPDGTAYDAKGEVVCASCFGSGYDPQPEAVDIAREGACRDCCGSGKPYDPSRDVDPPYVWSRPAVERQQVIEFSDRERQLLREVTQPPGVRPDDEEVQATMARIRLDR